MCGIAGIFDLQGRPIERPILERMTRRLTHRGPDDEGFYVQGPIGLSQRRLSIIDLSTGHQPMSNEDGQVWVTFNGEIYNFQELREELIGLGHQFRTVSDTETIVHAYEQFGADCVKRFRGMFALAIWDGRKQQLYLARDRVGKKPLFYGLADNKLVFASELQGLLEHPALRKEIDSTAIDDYLTYGYIPAPRTAYRGIAKLLPGHHLTIPRAQNGMVASLPEAQCYWQLQYEPKLELSEDEAAQGLLEVLTEAVRLRMIADVPLGALLSGGVDSSLVVALMSQLSSQPVKTFSIGFDDQAFNELPFARLVAQRYATDHHELVVRSNALEILPKLVRHYGEPYADSSAIPSYYVAQLTRQHVTVALNGDGGDECFAGYDRYLGSALADRYQRLPGVLRRGVIEPLAALIPGSLPRRNRLRQAKRFLQVASQPRPERYLSWVSFFRPESKQELYSQEFRKQLNGHQATSWLLDRFRQHANGHDALDTLLAVDVESYLPYDLLVKMDIATMANSLEARSPFLDHKVLEFAARLPVRNKIRGSVLKYLPKKVAEGLLPADNLHRRKMGFGVPVGDWMRHELRGLVEDVLLSPTALGRGYFRPDAVRNLVREHLETRQGNPDQLWALLWLELWHREM